MTYRTTIGFLRSRVNIWVKPAEREEVFRDLICDLRGDEPTWSRIRDQDELVFREEDARYAFERISDQPIRPNARWAYPNEFRHFLSGLMPHPGGGLPDAPCHDLRKGQVRVNSWGTESLVEVTRPGIGGRIFFYQDEVELRTAVIDGEIESVHVTFARIQPIRHFDPQSDRGHGGVLLPFDPKHGRVLCVTQWRHDRQRFMTELPRGFARPQESGVDAALREGKEEARAQPTKRVVDAVDRIRGASAHVYEVYELGNVATDSGKLIETPALVMAYVDYEAVNSELEKMTVAGENPVWIGAAPFFAAALREEAVQIGKHDIRRLDRFTPWFGDDPDCHVDVETGVGRLAFSDNFTIAAAGRALVRLHANNASRRGKQRPAWLDGLDPAALARFPAATG
ncbi:MULTISPECIES: NUDIX domain-containing protein [unclassified Sphingomonas]|jgi:ADP-ribose pyrophosphatase YjhB (NUDIX family)|uniref:NUDIX domain-containing protein n=1 Tax=unclassified Sphingomonas TaxID=196159 RepID=UPI000A940FAB|nr:MULTISPECIES: NUDIX domain-containing protein [unclassified Sphingomonas]